MHILLYNCLERLKPELKSLTRQPGVNVYLAVSESDVIRILNKTSIDMAVLLLPKVDVTMLHVLSAFEATQFHLFGVRKHELSRFSNLHPVGANLRSELFQSCVFPSDGSKDQKKNRMEEL